MIATPPNSPAPAAFSEPLAEERILASLLAFGLAAAPLDVLSRLSPAMFADGTHRAIFERLGGLHADRQPCCGLDVAAALRRDGMVDASARAIDLATAPNASPPSTLPVEVDRLTEAAHRRKVSAIGGRMREASEGGASVAEIVAGVRADFADMETEASPSRPAVKFRRPSELVAFCPPEGSVLVGDYHVTRGSLFVVGGAPGIGKSRAAVALAVAGAMERPWLGLSVHRRFRTLILQNENGPPRLKDEFSGLDCAALDDWLRVSEPPPFGMRFDRAEFRAAVAAAVAEFRPDVVVLDPWNAAAADDKQRDYLDAFEAVRSVLPNGPDAPALGIVAHTRKPKADERASGRGLLATLAGSYVLGSMPRSAFVMQAASDEPEDGRVVWTCCKNNDGQMGGRSAWARGNGLFAPVEGFDWQEFDRAGQGGGRGRRAVTEDDLAEAFGEDGALLSKSDAARLLMGATGLGRTACYDALKLGRFPRLAEVQGGFLQLK